MMNGRGKSDGFVVPEKPPNRDQTRSAEAVEGRDPTKGNAGQQTTSRTQSRSNDVSQTLDRVREAATTSRRQDPR